MSSWNVSALALGMKLINLSEESTWHSALSVRLTIKHTMKIPNFGRAVLRCSLALEMTVALFLLHPRTSVATENLYYDPVPRNVVETRLRSYSRDNRQRESILKQMFADAGCRDLSEQPVKGRNYPT